MELEQMEAYLFCIHCRCEEEHKICYVNKKLNSINCMGCNNGIEIKIDITKEFYKEVYRRISSKPTRITKEYREDLSEFLFSLPIRVISKPYRIIKDINGARKLINDFKADKKDIN